MNEEEFTLYEVLGVSKEEHPARTWIDRIPMWFRRFLRKHVSWPRLSPIERWEILCLIQEEFHKELEKHLIKKEQEQSTVIYEPPQGYWN